MKVQDIIDVVRGYSPEANVDLVLRAYQRAKVFHEGQVRESGSKYIQHPLHVAMILAELELDVITIAAGLLHDVVEDTQMSREALAEEFGQEVALLVDGVTKLGRVPFHSKEEQQAHNLRKMFLAMAQDLRVVLIKLADRLHNMRTLRHLSRERQLKIAKETVEIYAPLAHRLGVWRVKWELDDLCLRYLHPQEYYQLVNRVQKKRQEREGLISQVIEALSAKLVEVGIEADIHGRPKHFYSIYQKMVDQGKTFEEIYDLTAIRVVVDSVRDCYGVLGMVHTLWKPIPGRFKDYIAMPKSNMYQSLHTTVIGPQGEPLEIQIRTAEMHRTAEYGIAAHWRYKEGDASGQAFEEKISWLRQLYEWQREMKDVEEFMETLKIDLFEDEVFVFTPKGDVKTLPAGSTPIDFAYSVHSDVGNRCVGAKVDGKLVPLDYKLKNGEFVEILTGKQAGPSRDWLKLVKTSKARNRIRQWLKEQYREEAAEKGRELLEREFERLRFDLAVHLKMDPLTDLARGMGYQAIEDFYVAMGNGRVSAQKVLISLIGEKQVERQKQVLRDEAERRKKRPKRRPLGVQVEGVDDLLVRFSKCCNPVPGDAIVGYITRGRGVSVHRVDCPNLEELRREPEREMVVSWKADETGSYPVEIQIEADDRPDLLATIMNVLSESKTYVEAVNARTTKQRVAQINLVVDIEGVEQLQKIIQRIRRVDGVVGVDRASPT